MRIRGAIVDELRAQDWLTRRARTRVRLAEANGTSGTDVVFRVDQITDSESDGFVDGAPSPLDLVEEVADRKALRRAVALLPEREANIIAWHYFDDVPFMVIAVRLGVSEPRISQLHGRAVRLLKEQLAARSTAETAA
jgi:RNA polymerase sigma factor for flagellar operon FliA